MQAAPDPAAPVRVTVGVMVYNEAANLDGLLAELVAAAGPALEVARIVVVSSGSTDASVAIARRWVEEDARVRVRVERERRGKARAINLLLDELAPGTEAIVLVGGDVLPAPAALARLVAPFADPRVGISGAHPRPLNPRERWVDRVVHYQWELHHQVCLDRPKMGELIAFRPALAPLDPETAVDEAFLEAVAAARGLRAHYAAEALVLNHGPRTLPELFAQRRRIWNGHLRLYRATGHSVSTMSPTVLASHALARLREHPAELGVAASAALVELAARGVGTLDVLLRGANPVVWDRLPTTKVDLRGGAPRDPSEG